MGLPSWLSSSASTEKAPAPSALPPAPVFDIPRPPEQNPAPVSPSSRASARSRVNPNAPAYILTFGGAAFVLGLAISVRQIRKLKGTASEIAKAAVKAEAQAAGVVALDGRPLASTSRVPRTRSILSSHGRAGKEGQGVTLPVLQAQALATPASPPTSLPPLSSSTLAPSSFSPQAIRQPLFPPSKRRTVAPSSSSSSSSSSPMADLAASPSTSSDPTTRPTLLQMLREKDAPHPADGPVEEIPPVTARTVLYAFGAFGVATVLAVGVVAVPAVGLAYWLGVEKPSEFPLLFRKKIAEVLPSLGPSILRPTPTPTASAPAPTEQASPLPTYLQHGKDAPVLPGFLQQGTEEEGELEEGVYSWWERVRGEFERERREEVDRRRQEELERKGRPDTQV